MRLRRGCPCPPLHPIPRRLPLLLVTDMFVFPPSTRTGPKSISPKILQIILFKKSKQKNSLILFFYISRIFSFHSIFVSFCHPKKLRLDFFFLSLFVQCFFFHHQRRSKRIYMYIIDRHALHKALPSCRSTQMPA